MGYESVKFSISDWLLSVHIVYTHIILSPLLMSDGFTVASMECLYICRVQQWNHEPKTGDVDHLYIFIHQKYSRSLRHSTLTSAARGPLRLPPASCEFPDGARYAFAVA